MNISKILTEKAYLPITCSEEEFKATILSEIELFEKSFSFLELVENVRRKCEFKKDSNTEYRDGIDFMGTELSIINAIIWKQIWDKKLMIDFTNNRQNHRPDLFYFIKTKK